MKIRIISPIIVFALYSSLAALFGGIAGFFCIAKFSDAISAFTPFNSSDSLSIENFFETSSPSESFDADDIHSYINSVLCADFFAKKISSGQIFQTPEIEIKDGTIRLSLLVNAPIFGKSMYRKLDFEGRCVNGKLQMSGAYLGRARMPLFIAGLIFDSTLNSYKGGAIFSERLAQFEALKSVEIIGNQMRFTK